MKIFVGLGNPGAEYANTKHNVGFMLADKLAAELNTTDWRNNFNALVAETFFEGEKILIVKPQTFMNLSGEAVQPLAHFFKIDIKDIIIVYDDMALPPGTIRMRLSGSSGGQKGMQNIIEKFGTEEIKRIRIGIGEPPFDAIDYVLSKPTKDEQILIDEAINRAVEALKETIKTNFDRAMSKYN